jgi:hypothetical protein
MLKKCSVKFFFFLLLLWIVSTDLSIAQRLHYLKDGPDDKYFIAFYGGVGSASWNSSVTQSALYDTSGTRIVSGDFDFSMKNSIKNLGFDVSAQFNKVRLGMGICFEEFFLEKIKVNDVNYLFFDKFNFQKLFFQAELPLKNFEKQLISLNLKSQLGYYSYSHLNHINFFGGDNPSSVMMLNTGLLLDYKLFDHSYIYLHPLVEFKHFKNSRREAPSRIQHSIFSACLQFGMRFDLSRE